ncbi:MAG: hypothetical protein DBX59_05795 [Bacillota bacterium]|nr:MAG: hypothetical protein DBX59_05795 [Bacillota bacterium]
MDKFPKILQDLINEKQITVKQLQEHLNLSNVSQIYMWLRGKKGINLDHAIALANYFDCSLDYLMGKKEFDDENLQFKPCPPFGEQLKKVLKEKNVSQYKLTRETNFKGGHIYKWMICKSTPQMTSVIALADYLHVTIDYLVGREL